MRSNSAATMSNAKIVGYSATVILVALYVVGAVSVPPGSLRHEIQTLPLWFSIVGGFQQRQWAKWSALPCLIFWLIIMLLIWLFLLGWVRVVSGTFSATEIGMTLVAGAASLTGLTACLRWRTGVRPLIAAGTVVLFAVLQVGAFALSLTPSIARR
jgi:hypothetical protein